MSRMLGRDELLEAMAVMDELLGQRQVRATLFVVGGAAMSIAYDARRATSDVDAVFAPSQVVRDVADEVGQRLNLEPGWLNDGVKAFLPGEDPDRVGVYESEHLSVAVASPGFLLAMKLLASRSDRDRDDIRFLYELCGFSTSSEGLDLLASYYPERLVLPRVRFMLEEMFPPRDRGDDLGLGR